MSDETTALLIRARGFIERGWCRYTSAQNDGSVSVEACDDRAIRWCAWGALLAAGMPDDHKHPAYRLLLAATGGNIIRFNDGQETVEPVLAAFDAAIAMGDR